MPKETSFEQFLTGQSVQASALDFTINLLLTATLAVLLQWLYVHCGSSLANRRKFSGNFLLMGVTTMLIITVVKSSLALSLGLVGALSIVRFRTAIKDPEELCFLFLTIAMGLGLGASQRLITVLGFCLVAALIVGRHFLRGQQTETNLYLTVASEGQNRLELPGIVSALRDHCSELDLKRFDERDNQLEASFVVGFPSLEHLEAGRAALKRMNDSVSITFLDNKGLV
ncbi:MAG: DUF4956 domain-containing protein [Planctomycetota bacterium]